MHHYQDLITIFNGCFCEKYNTCLVKGLDEPVYLPADLQANRSHNELYFAHGFFASALHESAHWLIAGKERREQVDFGYWYVPDGRTCSEQALFQVVEVKPQAMEWILSQAANYRFRLSIDNLNGTEADSSAFKLAVYQQVQSYCKNGLSARAEMFRLAICQFYETSPVLKGEDFSLEQLS